MMLIDSHTHVHFPVYDADREAVLKRAKAARVKMVCVGTQAASSEAAVALAIKNPGEIWATAGFHPNHVVAQTSQTKRGLTRTDWYHDPNEQIETQPEKFDAERLRKIAENPKVVAIGEFGLDYYRLNNELGIMNKEKENQQEVFEVQIGIAKELKKPLMLHCRPSGGTDDAYLDAGRLLSTYDNLPDKIFHFYAGSLDMAKKLLDLGAYFTFGGVITFARDYDEVIKYIPIDKILLETDAPYVAPAPYRGKRNEPAYVVETAKKLAEIKNIDLEKTTEQTTKNASTVFKISV